MESRCCGFKWDAMDNLVYFHVYQELSTEKALVLGDINFCRFSHLENGFLLIETTNLVILNKENALSSMISAEYGIATN